jgi:hypothetical protein
VWGLPSSYRARRRLLWGSLAAAAVLGVAALIVFVPNTGHSTATPVDESKRAQVYHVPKSVRAKPADVRAAEHTLDTFVPSAVIRRDLERSWPLATPHMKEGTSHADWLAGNLPVVPYPANAFRSFGATLKYAYRGVLGFDVLVLPTEDAKGQKAGQQVYACELHELHKTWLVDFCYPRKTL